MAKKKGTGMSYFSMESNKSKKNAGNPHLSKSFTQYAIEELGDLNVTIDEGEPYQVLPKSKTNNDEL